MIRVEVISDISKDIDKHQEIHFANRLIRYSGDVFGANVSGFEIRD